MPIILITSRSKCSQI